MSDLGLGTTDGAAVEASARYTFARNPKAAITKAILDVVAQKSGRPRLVWKGLTGPDNANLALSPADFCTSIKGTGTGIQLEPCDVVIAFGSSEPITFERFLIFCG